MKLEDLFESETEKTTPDRAPPASDTVGHYISSAQVASLCNCSMSRVRQFKMEGRLKAAYPPTAGQRDNWFSKAEAQKFCDEERSRTGRKPKAIKNDTHGEKEEKK